MVLACSLLNEFFGDFQFTLRHTAYTEIVFDWCNNVRYNPSNTTATINNNFDYATEQK